MKTMKRTILSVICLLLCVIANAQGQRFFNLTVEDIKIDTVLPRFAYSIPLGVNYADSVYELEIKYPEFMPLSKLDEEKLNRLSSEKLPTLPQIEHQILVNRKSGSLSFSLLPIVERDGKKQFLVSFMVALTSKPILKGRKVQGYRAATQTNEDDIYVHQSVLANGRWAKIRIPESGIYNLTPELIRQAGFSDMKKVKLYGYGGNLQNEEIQTDRLIQTDDLKEIPTLLLNGKRLFYGKGTVSWATKTTVKRTRNPYSEYGYYFLTESDSDPLYLDSLAFMEQSYPMNEDYHSLHEIDNFSWYHGGRNLFENTPISVGNSKTYTLKNPTGSMVGSFGIGITTGKYTTTVEVSVNGEFLDNITIRPSDSYDFGFEAERVYDLTNLRPTDSITIKTIAGGPARLDYLSMAYENPRPAPDLKNGSFPVPEYVHNITNQNLHSHQPVDMVIIIPTSQKLLGEAQRLAKFHEQRDKMSVRIVPADELYNEFSSGTPDVMAYRRYMKMLYDRATTAEEIPQSLLLFGDCVWDNRMLTPENRVLDPNDYLLAYESENSFSQTDCFVNDGWIALMDEGEGVNLQSRDTEDIGVGRFPVVTASDAKIMVDKTIAYAENKNAGYWENIIMFMGDDGDNNLHMNDINATADEISYTYPGYQVKKVLWDAYTRETSSTGHSYPAVRNLILQQQAQGALIMDYGGHGSELQISHEAVLRISDFSNFTNTNYPLWITASCDIMPFDSNTNTIGEEALLNGKGGTMAFWGTTRTVYANYNAAINTAFLKHVLSYEDGKAITLGEAQRLAKVEMIDKKKDLTRNKLQYSLLGDPALRLNLPELSVVIDTINGLPVGGNTKITLKGGSIAKVKGRILKAGTQANDFNGLMGATVRDTREYILCKKQDANTRSAFGFYDRQKVLYNGTDSVKNGAFSFSFAVPVDLNYSEGTGLINIHAVNNAKTLMAHGSEEKFYINGTEEVNNDSIGPSIYCYLNNPSFVNGGNVNLTPYFYAEITDNDGINAAGNGIGHDIQLTIDGKMEWTYNLNDNFQFDFGSYTKGHTFFKIPELPEGRHQLKFRVWDILNNSSTATLNFNVVRGMTPEIENVSCTINPASTQTTFVVIHNYLGSNVNIEIDVFDTTGRLLWTHADLGVSTTSAYALDWDLTTSAGAPLKTGVYLYRVRLTVDGATKESKAKKLIVINNN